MADVSGFAAQILDGLFDPSPRESIFRVKDAVAKELLALDATAKVRSTNYFNHTFAPDFVMTWPDESSRRVYLRLTYDLDALVDDVALIDSTDPLIFGLTSPESVEAQPAIDQVIADTDAMFTEPSALERLIDRKQSDSTANMLSNALAQGGRGTFVADQAVDLADVVSRGFDAAAQVEFGPTAEAVTAIEDRLGGPQAWRMNRVLQAVWEGSEGSLTQFPGGADTSGRLNPESLRYLVKYMRTDDERFWKRVGRGLRLSDLETLDFDTDSDNIQWLMKANLDVIAARAAVVKSDPLGLDSPAEGELFRWARRGRHISFEAPNLFAVLGGAKKDLDDVEKDAAQAVSVERFIERSDGFDLIEVSVHSGPEHISAKIDEGAISTERLRGLSATFEGAGEVAQSIVSTRSGRVNVDLAERTGTGVTRSKILMADLVATTIPLVYDLPEEYRDALAEFLAYEKDDGQTPLDMSELDDEDEDGDNEDYGIIDPDTGEIAAFPGETAN
ncbi:hypothetical protein ACU6RU_14180 [Microbacterium sp. F1-18]